jgi:hypothetical protein
MSTTTVEQRRRVATGMTIEEVADGSWDELIRFAAHETATDLDWTRWRYEEYRRIPAPRHVQWYLARAEGEVIACGGIVTDRRFARFQEVVTRSDRRREGIALALCSNALVNVRNRVSTYVAVADEAVGADRLYRRLGMDITGYQCSLLIDVSRLDSLI